MDNQNTNPKQALVEKLKSSTNILVTVSSNPTVDQLAACLGLTLWLNKIGKHATAVFSGEVPSTLEFLQPEATLEKTTDSLRDFIISLDKSKADKLRYKVEDTVVKIFITPYRTSLSADDLEFSQGDFNVDMVVALGVSAQQDLDTAITAHGRILHDATVATITTGANSDLGSIGWHDDQTSSLSELVVDLGNTLDAKELDGQIATALLTGIVAETERFSNDKTTPQTMSISAQLMSAGANQQLVASKLDEPVVEHQPEQASPDESSAEETSEAPKNDDGTIEIAHEQAEEPQFELPSVDPEPQIEEVKETAPDEQTETPAPEAPAETEDSNSGSRLMTEPPTLGGTLTANSRPDDIMLEPTSDPLTQNASMPDQPLLDHDAEPAQADATPQPAPPDWMPPQPWMNQPAPDPAPEQPSQQFVPAPDETLAQIEQDVDSPHLSGVSDVDSARDEVMKAMAAVPDTNPDPIQALNAQSIDLATPPEAPAEPVSTAFDPAVFAIANDPETMIMPADPMPAPDPELTGPVAQPFTLPLPDSLTPPAANPVPPTSAANDPTAPPPVPPPLMPPGFPPAQ